MRILVGATLVLLLALSPASADTYGERLCTKFMPPVTPCACVGPILEGKFDEKELEPLMEFLRAYMMGLRGQDEAAAKKTAGRIIAEHGKERITDWLKRFEAIPPETAKTCNFKF